MLLLPFISLMSQSGLKNIGDVEALPSELREKALMLINSEASAK